MKQFCSNSKKKKLPKFGWIIIVQWISWERQYCCSTKSRLVPFGSLIATVWFA